MQAAATCCPLAPAINRATSRQQGDSGGPLLRLWQGPKRDVQVGGHGSGVRCSIHDVRLYSPHIPCPPCLCPMLPTSLALSAGAWAAAAKTTAGSPSLLAYALLVNLHLKRKNEPTAIPIEIRRVPCEQLPPLPWVAGAYTSVATYSAWIKSTSLQLLAGKVCSYSLLYCGRDARHVNVDGGSHRLLQPSSLAALDCYSGLASFSLTTSPLRAVLPFHDLRFQIHNISKVSLARASTTHASLSYWRQGSCPARDHMHHCQQSFLLHLTPVPIVCAGGWLALWSPFPLT